MYFHFENYNFQFNFADAMSTKIQNIDKARMVTQIRRDIVRMVHQVQSGHPGGSLGCVEFFVNLFFEVMNHDPEHFTMEACHQDMFFLSNGHITPVYYSTLARCGYFPIEELKTFRRIHSRLQGHPATLEGLPGIRVATGSLGQGLSVGVGAAQAKKLLQDEGIVYVLTGDGELNEGQIWEALLYAAHHQVDNLFITIDYNQQQIDGPTNEVMNMGDLKAKLLAFNLEVIECKQGNDLQAVHEALLKGKSLLRQGKPVVMLLHTVMGHGVSFMEGTHHWHGIAPNDEQLQIALNENPETYGDY
ncbi:MAG: transketolase [Bacteroidia bacterium]|nr:MAG: transketolase [Bacteroidia bacterium]